MIKFLREAFSEADGTGSMTRFLTGVIVLFELGWVSYLVVKHGALPDFGGLVIFGGFLYGLNKASAVTQNVTSSIAGKPEENKKEEGDKK
jgi:hypothetical protein